MYTYIHVYHSPIHSEMNFQLKILYGFKNGHTQHVLHQIYINVTTIYIQFHMVRGKYMYLRFLYPKKSSSHPSSKCSKGHEQSRNFYCTCTFKMVGDGLSLLQYMYVPDTLTPTKEFLKTMYMYIYMYIHTHMCCVYVTGHHTLYSQYKVMNMS